MISAFYSRYSRLILWCLVGTAPILFWQAESIPSNNDIETWLPRDTGVRQTYELFKQDFGGEEVIVLCVPESEHREQFLESLAGRLERLSGIRQAWTPARMQQRMESLGVQPEEARRRLAGLLVSPDEKHVGVVATLSPEGLQHRMDVVADVREVLAYCDPDQTVSLTGAPVIVTELDHLGSAKGNRRFFGLTLLISLGLLYYSFRHWGMALSVLGSTIWSIWLTQSLLYWAGGEMNFILGSLSVMVMIFTLSIAIHVVSYYSDAVSEGVADPLGHAFRASFYPCLLSTITTVLGLVSLNVSSILPVAQFGYAAAAGSIVAMFVGLGVTPCFLVLWPHCTVASSRFHRIDFAAWGNGVSRHRWSLLAAGAVGVLVMGVGVAQLKSDVDPVEFLPRNSRVLADLQTIEKNLTNVDSIEILVDFPDASTPFVDRLEKVRAIQQQVAGHPGVRHAFSLADFFPNELPDSPLAMGRMLSRAQSYSSDDALTAADHTLWRVSARIKDRKVCHPAKVYDDLTVMLADEPVTLTGVAPLLKSAQVEIFDGFWESFTAACLTISLVMIISLRSLVAGLIAMIPNILPIWLVFGGVGFLGMPVDIGMMMTGSIALGISVDCTFHFLLHYRAAYQRGASSAEACREALQHSGTPMLDSTLISGVGMLALCLSSFSPTARFGCLMAAQMLASLLGELVFLPALLACRPARVAVPDEQPVDEEPLPEIHRLPRPHFLAGEAVRAASP